jgi:hypothetical protein
MRRDMKRIRPGTVILMIVIVGLGSALVVQQRSEARLREALAAYKTRSRGQIVRVLGGWLPIDWPEGTTLEDAIELIKSRSSIAWRFFPKGVPILIDPDGLRRAGKTLKSPLKALPPDPYPPQIAFRKKLRAVLEPMGLAYEVKDGAIMITTPDSIDHPDVDTPEDNEGIAP